MGQLCLEQAAGTRHSAPPHLRPLQTGTPQRAGTGRMTTPLSLGFHSLRRPSRFSRQVCFLVHLNSAIPSAARWKTAAEADSITRFVGFTSTAATAGESSEKRGFNLTLLLQMTATLLKHAVALPFPGEPTGCVFQGEQLPASHRALQACHGRLVFVVGELSLKREK